MKDKKHKIFIFNQNHYYLKNQIDNLVNDILDFPNHYLLKDYGFSDGSKNFLIITSKLTRKDLTKKINNYILLKDIIE